MGLETILIISAIAISVGTAAYAAVATNKSKSKQKQDITSIQITRAEEGQVIPIIYGTVRVPGSIIWYGNVRYYPIEAKGGKGGGGGGGVSGYRTFVDVHLVLCEGKATLEDIYKDEEVYQCNASIVYNDGTTNSYVQYAEFSSKIPGVAHIFLGNWSLGENQFSPPPLLFKMKKILTTPIVSTVTTGENPACIVYDILTRTGGTCDLVSFQEVADAYNVLNWGLNLVFDSQQEVEKMLETVFSHLEMVLYKENDIFYVSQSHRAQFNLPQSAVILQKDVKDFVFTRTSYSQIYNDFAANYKDANNTDRTVRLVNEAVYSITGENKNHSYELKGFNSLDVVKARFSEMFDRDSYPFSEITAKLPLSYYFLLPGNLIALEADFFVGQKDFIISKIIKNPFAGEVEITAREYPNVTDGQYNPGESKGSGNAIDFTPYPLDHVHVTVIKYGIYRNFTGKIFLLILPVKKTGVEYAYDIYFSRDGLSYEYKKTSYTFAYSGILEEAYPSDTYDIDDQKGILVAYSNIEYSLDDITRSELFSTTRVAVIDNEIMKYQTAEEEGENLRILGVLRDSQKQTHAITSQIYFTDVSDNVIDIPFVKECYIKICPRTRRGVLDQSEASSIHIEPEYQIEPVSFIKATRNGSDITIEIFPNTQKALGCGYGDANIVTDSIPHPFSFEGIILLSTNNWVSTITLNTTIYQFSNSGEITVYVKQQAYGLTSIVKNVFVGSEDGEYFS